MTNKIFLLLENTVDDLEIRPADILAEGDVEILEAEAMVLDNLIIEAEFVEDAESDLQDAIESYGEGETDGEAEQ